MSVDHLPLPKNATASEILNSCATRGFDEVLVLGTYPDRELRHASTMTLQRQLWMLKIYEAKLLGIIEGATIPKGADA